MAGEWIEGKARGLVGSFFPGSWEEVSAGVLQGRCPGEEAHTGRSAATDCRIYLTYGAGGETPGAYCLHSSCKGVLEPMNEGFRSVLFAKDGDCKGGGGGNGAADVNAGVVKRAPQKREAWVPEFNAGKLLGVVQHVPGVAEEWFMERSPVDVRKMTPGGFFEEVFSPGERVLVFTDFRSQGDFLWEVGKGGFRLGTQAGVQAVKSALPVDGGKDGVWFLSNPVDGQWHGNPRAGGKPSRRSTESVTRWKHLVLESDEAPAEQWLRLLACCGLPIVAIYSSGGRSWHALVKEDHGEDAAGFKEKLKEYKRRLPLVGADPGAMTPVRLTRAPGCTRGGKLQRLIWCNPGANSTKVERILEMGVRRSLK